MFRTSWIALLCLILGPVPPLFAASTDLGEGCQNSPERPYVCDIGSPRVLSKREFAEVLDKNSALRETVTRLGKPDRAEIQKVRVREPWSPWEVRTYYEDLDRMFIYGRAYILGSPVITILRHESRIPRTQMARGGGTAADRAAQGAAERAAAAAERSAAAAERTAQLAEALADDAGEQFPRRLMKK
ncbi:MAG: hypothetical protein P8K76_11945 [Candidatus Binatia bacterium]|nr:hypothetical protein [Candidatus Binatia bacterium]MDG2010487.1 hypothetical protein [Candidatus Binatia bacterium]